VCVVAQSRLASPNSVPILISLPSESEPAVQLMLPLSSDEVDRRRTIQHSRFNIQPPRIRYYSLMKHSVAAALLCTIKMARDTRVDTIRLVLPEFYHPQWIAHAVVRRGFPSVGFCLVAVRYVHALVPFTIHLSLNKV